MSDRPRYLLDTEALIRAFRSDGPARELLQRGMVRDMSFVTSTTVLDELDDVLARPKFGVARSDREAIRTVLIRAADEVAIFEEHEASRHVPRDPGDDHVVEAALRTEADVLVTHDDAFDEVAGSPFQVMEDGAACQALRDGFPYGDLRLQAPQEREELARALGRSVAASPRRAAYDLLVSATSDVIFEAGDGGLMWAALGSSHACDLVTDLVANAGPGLLVDLRDGGSYDYLSGTRSDIGRRGAAPALDIIWYSSDRAAAEADAEPHVPTISDYGWSDDHRHRVVLAGLLLVIVPVEGPEGEPDVRGLFPVSEPLAVPPLIDNAYRITTPGRAGEDLTVLALDPAGFTSSTWTWLAGGPSSFIATTALDHAALQRLFLAADLAAQIRGLPIPDPAVLQQTLPARLHPLITSGRTDRA
ncbi:MAG: putative toxin-antitoxin system toxin component, PIN family [Actinomycetota bacterium]